MTSKAAYGPKIAPDRLPVECPTCEQIIITETGRTIEAAVTAHDLRCPGTPPPATNRADRIECGDCGRHLGDVGHSGHGDTALQISRLFDLHTCPPQRTGRPTTMTAPIPVKAPPGEGACPPAQQLLTHPSKRVARQAAKVLAETSKLAEAWKADAGNAQIRAQIAAKEAEIKALRAKLQQPGPKPKAS